MTTAAEFRTGSDNKSLHRAMLTLVVFAYAGFGLSNAVMGFPFAGKAAIIHVHAVLMTIWLALLLVQNHLGSYGSLSLHRKLGMSGLALAVLIVVTGLMTLAQKLGDGTLPPFFTPGYFMLLGGGNLLMFAAFITAAVIKRKDTAWHRRLMLASIIAIYEPVLGRVLPFFVIPALGDPADAMELIMANRGLLEIVRVVTHLAIVLAVMFVDRAATGRFHPVYTALLLSVVAFYAAVNGIGTLPAVEALASA